MSSASSAKMVKMIHFVVIDRNCFLKPMTTKHGDCSDLYKKCGYKTDDTFVCVGHIPFAMFVEASKSLHSYRIDVYGRGKPATGGISPNGISSGSSGAATTADIVLSSASSTAATKRVLNMENRFRFPAPHQDIVANGNLAIALIDMATGEMVDFTLDLFERCVDYLDKVSSSSSSSLPLDPLTIPNRLEISFCLETRGRKRQLENDVDLEDVSGSGVGAVSQIVPRQLCRPSASCSVLGGEEQRGIGVGNAVEGSGGGGGGGGGNKSRKTKMTEEEKQAVADARAAARKLAEEEKEMRRLQKQQKKQERETAKAAAALDRKKRCRSGGGASSGAAAATAGVDVTEDCWEDGDDGSDEGEVSAARKRPRTTRQAAHGEVGDDDNSATGGGGSSRQSSLLSTKVKKTRKAYVKKTKTKSATGGKKRKEKKYMSVLHCFTELTEEPYLLPSP